jgi:uncharacterized membrane protein
MAKTATYGILHMGSSFGIAYALTGSVKIAGAVTFVEPIVNTGLHYVLDKYWDHPTARRVRQIISRQTPVQSRNHQPHPETARP